MKAKKGYLRDKTDYRIGRWLKLYFEKRTCRKLTMKDLFPPENYDEHYYELLEDLEK